MKKTIPFLLILFATYLLSCTKVNNENSGYQDSELTLLMRAMEGDVKIMKQQILRGESPDIPAQYRKIMEAHATEPEKSASAEFKLYAETYMTAVETLKNTDKSGIEQKYDLMITTCMNCHRALCPGPMVRIKKLYLN